MPEEVSVKVGEKVLKFAKPLDAVVWLLANHCGAIEIQSIRGDLGRDILKTLEVRTHDNSLSPDQWKPKPGKRKADAPGGDSGG